MKLVTKIRELIERRNRAQLLNDVKKTYRDPQYENKKLFAALILLATSMSLSLMGFTYVKENNLLEEEIIEEMTEKPMVEDIYLDEEIYPLPLLHEVEEDPDVILGKIVVKDELHGSTNETIEFYDKGEYELQGVLEYMRYVGKINDIPGEILEGIAYYESQFTFDAVSPTNDYGLMQINKSNFKMLHEYGIYDFYNPYSSVDAAIIIINRTRDSMPSSYQNDWNKILMAYNMGIGTAQEKWRVGQTSSSYSRLIIKYAAELGYVG